VFKKVDLWWFRGGKIMFISLMRRKNINLKKKKTDMKKEFEHERK